MVAASVFLTNLSLCCAAETSAKKILTSFVSCQILNTALDKAGISDKMLHDANSNAIVSRKVLSMLSDSNSAKLFANPKISTLDGESGRIELSNICNVDLIAAIQGKSLIVLKFDWQKSDRSSPGIESVKTRIKLRSGKPAIVGCHRSNDRTFFLIVTSEILDANKSNANSP
jgi:hypothetical protein